MVEHEPTMEQLRVELSNLRDDLTVIKSSDIYATRAIGNLDAVKAMRNRIAEIEAILERNKQ